MQPVVRCSDRARDGGASSTLQAAEHGTDSAVGAAHRGQQPRRQRQKGRREDARFVLDGAQKIRRKNTRTHTYARGDTWKTHHVGMRSRNKCGSVRVNAGRITKSAFVCVSAGAADGRPCSSSTTTKMSGGTLLKNIRPGGEISIPSRYCSE